MLSQSPPLLLSLLLHIILNVHGFSIRSVGSRNLPSPLRMSGEFQESMESLRSLVDFHEGSWRGKASSFTVTSDAASGVVKRSESPEYTTTIKIGMNLQDRDYSYTEALEWHDKVATRTLSLVEANCDVDSVDGSYSLDSTTSNLPADIIGTEKLIRFGIEHCIAVNDDERIRCFIGYGLDGSLERIAICEEVRIPDTEKSTQNRVGMTNELMSSPSLAKFAESLPNGPKSDSVLDAVILGSENENGFPPSPTPSPETMMPKQEEPALRPCPMNLVQLGGGLWLGDIIVRQPVSYQEVKGFGAEAGIRESQKSFARWSTGVQKVVNQWSFDFEDSVNKGVNVGKPIGIPMAQELGGSLSGLVCQDETFSMQIPSDQKFLFIDWNGGEFAGFIKGHIGIQVRTI